MREAVSALKQVGSDFLLSSDEQEFLGPIDPDAMLAELKKPETTHKRRLLIGERLDVLGDPRPGINFDTKGTPEIDWCFLPRGEVTLLVRSDPNDLRSEEKHTLPKQVDIARYPITVAQYRAFIAANDGWRDPAWWGEDLYRDEEADTYDFGRFGNHPAVSVSWFDAVAFCRWLSWRLDLPVRLPDEWEWQLAATGGDESNVFPWGADWDAKQEPWRANTFESRLGGVTAVGMYPAGASPVGALDMAGTVWEWCLNKLDRSQGSQSYANNFDERVLRGGSWNFNRDHARSALRTSSSPGNRSDTFGFRVVCSSPSTMQGEAARSPMVDDRFRERGA